MTSLLNKEIGMSQINVGRVVGSRIYTEEKPESPLDGDIFIDEESNLYSYNAETDTWEFYISIRGIPGISITGLEVRETSNTAIYELWYYLSDGTEALAGIFTAGGGTGLIVVDSQGIYGSYDGADNSAWINGIEYHLDGKNDEGINVCSVISFNSDGCNGTVVLDWISVYGTVYYVTSVPASSSTPYIFRNQTVITSVVLGSYVTSIGSYAFRSCTSLVSADMPSVTSIEGYAFYGCSSLVSVDMPSVTSIEKYAFYDCSSLVSVDMSSVTSIENYAFQRCTSLVSADMPSVTSIGGYVFQSCSSLVSVDMPSVTSIGSYAFNLCTSLVSVDMPSVTSIDDYTFRNCTSLSDVYIGRNSSGVTFSYTNPGNRSRALAFEGCTALHNVYFYCDVNFSKGSTNIDASPFDYGNNIYFYFLLNCSAINNAWWEYIDSAIYDIVYNSIRPYDTVTGMVYLGSNCESVASRTFYNSNATGFPVYSARASISRGSGTFTNCTFNYNWDEKTIYDVNGNIIGELVDGKAVYY